MSIARVRIAPVERWCEFAQGYLSECPGFERVAGATIPIESVSMQVRPADFYHNGLKSFQLNHGPKSHSAGESQ